MIYSPISITHLLGFIIADVCDNIRDDIILDIVTKEIKGSDSEFQHNEKDILEKLVDLTWDDIAINKDYLEMKASLINDISHMMFMGNIDIAKEMRTLAGKIDEKWIEAKDRKRPTQKIEATFEKR